MKCCWSQWRSWCLCKTCGWCRSSVTSYPSFLLEVGDHDNNSNILLPDHPPEVFPARSERPLSCDISPCSLITLQRKPLFSHNVQCISNNGRQDPPNTQRVSGFDLTWKQLRWFGLHRCASLLINTRGWQKHTYIHKVGIDVVPTFPISVQTAGELDSTVVVWERKRFTSFVTAVFNNYI